MSIIVKHLLKRPC